MKTLLSDDVVVLRHLEVADADGAYRHWFNDPEVVRHNSHGRFPMTVEQLKKYVVECQQDRGTMVLAVVLRETGRHVGNISLQRINWIDRNAEIAFVLGESDCHGKGIMQRAGALLIQHAFHTLNLHRVYCGTLATNEGMKKLAVKLNMKEEGCRKEAIFKDGRYLDIIEYGVLNPRACS